MENNIVCPKCGNSNVNIQVVNYAVLKNSHHGIIWWLLVGWWWIIIKWIFFTGIALIFWLLKLFGIRKKKIKNIEKTKYVCQSCGHSWDK